MSEAKNNKPVQSPNDQTEADEIGTTELDVVAGGVLALQELEGGEAQPEGGATSYVSIGCTCSEELISG